MLQNEPGAAVADNTLPIGTVRTAIHNEAVTLLALIAGLAAQQRKVATLAFRRGALSHGHAFAHELAIFRFHGRFPSPLASPFSRRNGSSSDRPRRHPPNRDAHSSRSRCPLGALRGRNQSSQAPFGICAG